jgi:hypothetical protein
MQSASEGEGGGRGIGGSGTEQPSRYHDFDGIVYLHGRVALNELDQQELSSNNLPAVRGYLAFNVPALPARLSCFGTWND